MKIEKTKNQKRIKTLFLGIVLIIALSFVFNFFWQNHNYVTRDRLIIHCYQTNIGGSDGEKWAEHLKKQFPDIPDFEVSVYDTKSAGNDSITITTENGWSQISTRLYNGEGDILLVDNSTFYNVLMAQDLILPLNGDFDTPVTDKNGVVFGVDVTGKTTEGLLNYGTSKYVAQGQKLPIMPLDHSEFSLNGFNYSPRIIAVVFKGSEKAEQSQELLSTLFGEVDNE